MDGSVSQQQVQFRECSVAWGKNTFILSETVAGSPLAASAVRTTLPWAGACWCLGAIIATLENVL